MIQPVGSGHRMNSFGLNPNLPPMLLARHARRFATLVRVVLFTTGVLTGAEVRAESNILARVALLSDSHMNLATNGEQAAYAAHFQKAIADANAAGVDFVLIAGDLTQSGKPEEYAAFKANLANARAPVWVVPGNHDVGAKFDSGNPEHTTLARVATYEKWMGQSWFATNCAGVRVIGINSSILGSGFACETQMWNFLETELSRPVPEPTLLVLHYPIFVNELDEPGGKYWDIEPAPRARLYALLKQGGVKTVLSGHLHRPLVNRRDGILFVTTPPTSFGLPAGEQAEGWMLITLYRDGKVTEVFRAIK